LIRGTKIVRENHRLGSVLHQPAADGVAHDRQGPRASIDGTETLDAAKRAQRGILHNVFGVLGIAGEPSRETMGFGHVWQQDFIEYCAFIFVLHNRDRRLLRAGQTI
jgi:hypothetical protein